jgi:hypothetical protein
MRGVRAVAEFHKVDGTRTLEGVTGGGVRPPASPIFSLSESDGRSEAVH